MGPNAVRNSKVHLILLIGFSVCPPAAIVNNSINYLVSNSLKAYEKVAPTGMACDKVTDGKLCYYQCEEGFTMQGTPYLRCESGGVWKGEAPVCKGRLKVGGLVEH